MRYWIAAIVLFVAAGAYGAYVWRHIANSIEISKPLIASTVPYQQLTSSSSRRILVAGDSLGVGVGAADPKDSLAGRIGRELPQTNITNISVSGARLKDLKEKLYEFQPVGFDLVFITIGANDITQGTSFDEIRNSLKEVLEKAAKTGNKVVVLTAGNVGLSPAFLWPLSSYIEYRTREVRKIFIEEISKYPSVTYIDLFQERKDEIFNTDIPRYYAPDLFHPSGDGYEIWFEKLRPLL